MPYWPPTVFKYCILLVLFKFLIFIFFSFFFFSLTANAKFCFYTKDSNCKSPHELLNLSKSYHSFYIRIIHGRPGSRVATYRPGIHDDIVRRKPQLVYTILHHCIYSILLLGREGHTLKFKYTTIKDYLNNFNIA